MTFISIIVPFKKGKRFLKDCLDSLVEQNLSDSEIILILNGITEDLDELIKIYSNSLNLIIKKYDGELGVAKARNEALKIATGDYIYFLDSDDYLYEQSLNKLINIAHNTNADFINGERIKTSFIRERFNEQLEKEYIEPLKKGKFSDLEFSIKLLVGDKTEFYDILSVLHALIKKDVIGHIRFNENKKYLVDYEFIMGILGNIKSFIGVENAFYAKRFSDDPIKLPSLNQEKKTDEFLIYAKEYKKVSNEIIQLNENKYKILQEEIANKFFNSYYSDYANNFFVNHNNKWRNEYFNYMSDISNDFNVNKFNILLKKEIKSLQLKNKTKLRHYIRLRAAINKIKLMKNNTWMIKHLFYTKFFNKKPIKDNQIFIESFRGDFYSDSPKYIYEYLNNHYGNKYDYVWVINTKTKIPGNPKRVKRFSFKYYKEMGRSKYLLINTRQTPRLIKRNNQIIISTWHGTPLKRLGFDQENIHMDNPDSKIAYKNDSKEWDYLISPNKYTTDILRSSFAYNGEVLQTGYPRNDILYNASQEKINQIKNGLKLPLDKKIIFYAPTWRDDESFDVGKVNFELKLDLDKLQESLSDEYVILIRTHYFIANKLDLSKYKNFVFDVSRYDDIAELYLISDILITDYSSVFFDFANLKRPILFYTYDLDKYENVLRGFYIDIRSEVPGPLLFTSDEVIDAVKNIESINDQFKEKYNEFYNRFCYLEDGNASKRVVEKIWD